MKIYLAGGGHNLIIDNKKFLKKIRAFLISYFYLLEERKAGGELTRRMAYVKKKKGRK